MTGNAQRLITVLLEVMRSHPDKLWDLKEHKEKRTLTQNAYYWVLLNKTAKALRMTSTELHNRMLRDVAPKATVDGNIIKILLPDTEGTEEQALKSETVHLKPTSQTTVLADGKTYRTWNLLKGSSQLDTAEMGQLLDNLIREAQEIGVETLTPRELKMMREAENGKKVNHAES